MRRHGVEHLVRDHHATKIVRQRIDPARRRAQPGALARGELRARLENQVLGLEAERGERLDQPIGERAAAGAELEHRVAGGEQLGDLAREAAREQAAELGRRDEIARGTEIRIAARVIAEPGRMQHERHVACEAHPVAARPQLLRDAREERGARRARVGMGLWQGVRGHGAGC